MKEIKKKGVGIKSGSRNRVLQGNRKGTKQMGSCEPGSCVQHYVIGSYNYLLLPGKAVKFLGRDYIKLNAYISIFLLRVTFWYLHQTLSVFFL